MKKLTLASAVSAAALLLTQPAAAAGFFEEVTWVPQIGVQYKNLEFDQKLFQDGVEVDQGDLDADVPSLALSFTGIYKKAYLSLKYEQSLSDAHADSDVPFTNASTEVERRDLTLTFGYNVWNNLNLFVGYMEGKTTFTPEPRCPVDDSLGNGSPFICDLDFAADTGFEFEGNLAQALLTEGRGDYEQEYEEDGWFVGAGYAWSIKDTGTLSVSLAYADLDSVYEDNYFPEDDADFRLKGDADGFSLGINWSQPLTKRLGYYLDLRTHQYDADTKDDNGNFPGLEAESEETITTFTAGLQWYL